MDVRRNAIVIIALLLVCIGVLAVMRHEPAAGVPPLPPPVPPSELATRIMTSAHAPTASDSAPAAPVTPAPSQPAAETPAMPTAADEAAAHARLEAARAAGLRTGLAAFNPAGTSPLKRGVVVPDGYQLPPGYVRHFQVTDHGKQLRPILMYRPGFTPVDAAGQPIAVPRDRVVPAENAPPGMPVEMLELP